MPKITTKMEKEFLKYSLILDRNATLKNSEMAITLGLRVRKRRYFFLRHLLQRVMWEVMLQLIS